jgi:F-box/TPR repeat protein Pof3
VLYDSRASAYEKQNRLKDALHDAKKTIEIAPNQWHGYFRSARLFAALGQARTALRMCSLALERLGDGPKHEARRRELSDLRLHLEEQTKCPVLAMPVELLLMIFRLSRNPVVISHVCHRWREVALSQPTLWCSLVLTASAKKALLKVKEWHRRSHGRIVELTIRQSLASLIFPSEHNNSHPDDRIMYANLLAALRQLDWTVLKESYLEGVNAESFFHALNDGTRLVHQHLETLSIKYANLFEVIISTGPRQYDELPWDNLRAFRITNAGCDWKRLSANMRHLTSFEFKIETTTFASVTDFLQFHPFLQANLCLEKLVIDTPLSHRPSEIPDSLTLAHLRHLELGGVVPFRVKSGNFSLPSLQTLRMTRLRNAASILSELVKDEGTSFAGLVELTARDCALGSQLLTSVLLRAPKLETLNCTGDAINDAAESLTARPCAALQRDQTLGESELVVTNLPILCPALSVLDLSQSASLKTGPVMRIVKERIALAASEDGGRYQLPEQDGDRVVSRIRVLKVDECPHMEAEILPWFRNNVQHFSCRYELRRKR